MRKKLSKTVIWKGLWTFFGPYLQVLFCGFGWAAGTECDESYRLFTQEHLIRTWWQKHGEVENHRGKVKGHIIKRLKAKIIRYCYCWDKRVLTTTLTYTLIRYHTLSYTLLHSHILIRSPTLSYALIIMLSYAHFHSLTHLYTSCTLFLYVWWTPELGFMEIIYFVLFVIFFFLYYLGTSSL